MLEIIKELFQVYEEPNNDERLSPSTLALLENYAGFEEDASIISIGIYPEKEILRANLNCLVASLSSEYIYKRIEITFNGVPDVSATYKGEILGQNEIIRLPYELDVEFLEVGGTGRFKDRDKVFHTHILKLIAEDLIVMFTFADLSFREISGEK